MTLERRREVCRPFGREHVAALSGREAAAFDRWAIDQLGIPSPVLIETAGRSAAFLAQHLVPEGAVVVLAGKGNNGADAVVVARTLRSWGRPTWLVPVVGDSPVSSLEGSSSKLSSLDLSFLHGWDVPLLALADAEAKIAGASLVIDGILGTGLRGPPRDQAAEAIATVNRAPGLVVSLDIPSGVDADTGAAYEAAVRADVTIGFGAAKLGVVLHPGRSHSGRSVVVDIGFPPLEEPSTRLLTPAWASARLPGREADAHKNSVGAVCVVAGRSGMAGAAVLAARAALRTGAGYVRVATDASNREIVQGAVPEAVFVDRDDPQALSDAVRESRAVLVGPGMGTDDAAAAVFEGVWVAVSSRTTTSLVIDADGLTHFGERSVPLANVLLTPHLGEMARLTGSAIPELRADPLGAARHLAAERKVSVLLKGAPTAVVNAVGTAWIATSQSSDLAVAGMGDALAGAITGFAAQGLAPDVAAGVAVEMTARAADLAGLGPSLTPSDVIEALADALKERGPGDTDLPFPFVLFDQDPPR